MLLLVLMFFSFGLSSKAFVWQLQLKEFHPSGVDFSQGLYYFDYSCAPTFCSRQENNVLFSPWRNADGVDVPYNIFFAFNSTLSVEFLDNEKGAIAKQKIGSYSNSFWPQDWLASACSLFSSNVTLGDEFSGRFNDGKKDLLGYNCNILQNDHVTAFVSRDGSLVRLVIGKQLPLWEPQIWDVISETYFDAPIPQSFLDPKV